MSIFNKNDIDNRVEDLATKSKDELIQRLVDYEIESDYDRILKSIKRSNIKFVETVGDFEDALDDNKYIAINGGFDEDLVIAFEFSNSEVIRDVYFADAVSSLEEFKNTTKL